MEQFRKGILGSTITFDVGLARNFPIAGWEPLHYVMQQWVVRKAFEKHQIDTFAMVNLPTKMALPIAVFRSRTQPGAFTMLLDAKANGESLIAAVHFKELQGRGRVAFIPSVHHKTTQSILWWIEQGDGVLYDPKKCQEWLQNSAPSNWEQYADHLGCLQCKTT